MKNEFAREYFQNLKREPSVAEAKLIETIEQELALGANLDYEITDVRLPEGNMDVISAYAVSSRLYEQLGDEKLTLRGVATATERKYASTLKKKNYEIEDVPTFSVKVNEEGDESAFAVSIAGGQDSVSDAIIKLGEKRVVPGTAFSAYSVCDPAKSKSGTNTIELHGKISEITGVSHASRVKIVRDEHRQNNMTLAVGSAPIGQISKKKIKEGDNLILLQLGEFNAHALRAMNRLLRVQKLARPMIALYDVKEGGILRSAARIFKGCELDCQSLPVADCIEGAYLAVVRGNELDDWCKDITEVGASVKMIGQVNETSKLCVRAGDEVVADLDVDLIKRIAPVRKVNAVLPNESGAKFDGIDALTAIYVEKGDYVNAAKADLARMDVISKKGIEAVADGAAGNEFAVLRFGGKNGLTPSIISAVKTHAAGENYVVLSQAAFSSLSGQFPFISSVNALACAITKQLVSGIGLSDIRLFTATATDGAGDPVSMGARLAAILGANYVFNALGMHSCGAPIVLSGKDGADTFAFAVGVTQRDRLGANVFTKEGRVYRIALPRSSTGVPDMEYIKKLATAFADARAAGAEWSATVVDEGDSVATAVIKSCLGSGMGFYFHKPSEKLFQQTAGDVLITCTDIKHFAGLGVEYVGEVQTGVSFEFGTKVLNTFGVSQNWTAYLERCLPTVATNMRGLVENVRFKTAKEAKCITPIRPRVFIPVLRGTNNEYYLAKCFRDVGAIPVPINLCAEHTDEVVAATAEALSKCQIIAITDGLIDETERQRFVQLMCNPAVKAEADKLMGEREGLAIGTGAGYDILNRLGLLAGDEINPKKRDIELTCGNLNRRIFTTAMIKVVSTLSPWLYAVEPGEVFGVRLATTDGRLDASAERLDDLVRTGRISTQFVDAEGFATMESPYNVTGAAMAIEGIFSPSGRTWGRCAVNEKTDANYVGTDSAWDMKIFESGVKYFK